MNGPSQKPLSLPAAIWDLAAADFIASNGKIRQELHEVLAGR